MKINDVIKKLAIAEKMCINQEYEKADRILKKIILFNYKCENTIDIQKYYFLSGICAYERCNFVLAIEHFSNCIRLIDESASNDNNNFARKSNVLYELSLCYFALFQKSKKLCDLQTSIDYCQQSIAECIDYSLTKKCTGLMVYYVESPEHYLSQLVHLAVLYQSKKEFDKSNQILEVALVCCKRHYDWKTLGKVYDELGSNNRCLGKFENALYYYGKALKAKKFIGNEKGLDITSNNIIICLIQKKQVELESNYSSNELNIQHFLEEESL